jgi:hypothetical protein
VPWHAVPAALQGVDAPQATGFCAGQTPLEQVTAGMACALGMLPEQDAAAPQDVPFATGAWQTPARHVSSVQTLLSLPHGVPSATFVWTQPLALLHESVVQGLLSLQFTALPVHVPL